MSRLFLSRLFGTRRGKLAAAVVTALVVAGGALAYFTSTGHGAGAASVGYLNAPAKPTAVANGTGRVDVSWHQASLSTGSTLAQHYYVSRYNGSTLDGYACGTSPTGTTIPASAADGSGNFTCSDTGLTNAGPYTYTVTAVYKSWTAESVKSDAVTVSLVGPLDHFLLSAASSTPTAGQGDNLAITAKDASNNTITTYSGNHSLTFSGANAIGSFQPTVTDAAGNAVVFGSAETMSFSSGVASVSASSNGVMKLYKAESPTISVSDGSGHTGSTNVTVSPAAANQLAFAQSPANTSADNALSPQPQVTVQDQFGNTVTSDSSSITLSITSGTPTSGGPGSLSNCAANPKAATSGVATFSGCKITTTGTGYKLHATDGSLSAADSAAFNITLGAAAQLVFTQQPSNSTGGVAFPTQPKVAVEDAGGNIETADNSTTVTVAIGTNPGSGTLSGTKTVTVASGVATFSGLSIDKIGTGYTLSATSSPAHGTTTSNTFNITAGSAVKFNLSASAGSITAGGTVNLTITAVDAGGNTATSYTGDQSLTFAGANSIGPNTPTVSSKTGAAVAFGTATTITFTNGVATVSGSNNGVATLYKAESASITATASGVSAGTAAAVTVNIGTAAKLAWAPITAPATGVPTSCYFTCTYPAFGNNNTFTARVSITDSAGNIVSNIGSTTTISVSAVAQSSGGAFTAPIAGAGPESLTIPASGAATSSASFSYRTGNGTWTSDSLTAHVTAGTARTDATATLNKN